MTRQEQLRFCKVCDNQSFDRQKGIICKLTNDIASFDSDCAEFIGDREKIVEFNIASKENQRNKNKIFDFFSLFIPKDGFFITPILINICILIFIVMVISGVNAFLPDTESLIKWGANFTPLTLGGQYWRLISNCFLHIGVIHLLFNMYALMYIGLLLEPFIGKTRFGIAFLITGIGGSVISLWWHDLIVSAGASGAIFGLFGVYIALLLTNLIDKETRKKILTSLLLFVGYNLIYGLKGGIDNAAHIGGLLIGIIFGITLFPSLSQPEKKIRNLILNTTSIIGILVFTSFVILRTPNDVAKYEKFMSGFIDIEQKAMSFYRVQPYSTDDKYLKAIKVDGIPNWKKCKEIVNQVDSLENLPIELIDRVELLSRYCDYRIESFELMKKSLVEKSRIYDYQINAYNQKIELIIKKLQGEQIPDSILIVNPTPIINSNIQKGQLYVVDGYPIDNQADIDPNNIESVQVLKGEAAIQLYGNRARDGVILIQTKK